MVDAKCLVPSLSSPSAVAQLRNADTGTGRKEGGEGGKRKGEKGEGEDGESEGAREKGDRKGGKGCCNYVF